MRTTQKAVSCYWAKGTDGLEKGRGEKFATDLEELNFLPQSIERRERDGGSYRNMCLNNQKQGSGPKQYLGQGNGGNCSSWRERDASKNNNILNKE